MPWATGLLVDALSKLCLNNSIVVHELVELILTVVFSFSKRDQFTIVPILVGSLSVEKEIKYGRILSKYLAKHENFFVISSDFCHWGKMGEILCDKRQES